MKQVFKAPESLKPNVMHYCPGCGHSIIHRLVAEVIDELGIRERCIGVPPAGCAVLAYNYLNVDMGEAPHGRALAVATGIKRVQPDKVVFTYQGDGDIAAIGTAESIHAANRGEKLTAIFVNNGTYGMTGGQMAPTSMVGQKTTTSPKGRNQASEGAPLKMAEIMAQLGGVAYSARCALDTVAHVRAAKKALQKAFQVQREGLGFGFVELLSGCPTNLHLDPLAANKRIGAEMIPVFPLGVYKDITADAGKGEGR